jgi:hypothetical protein
VVLIRVRCVSPVAPGLAGMCTEERTKQETARKKEAAIDTEFKQARFYFCVTLLPSGLRCSYSSSLGLVVC